MCNEHRPKSSQSRTIRAERDQAWLAGLRVGRFDIFQQIFEAYTEELGRFACLSVPRDVAEDIVQDVMFDIWQRRETIDVREGLAGYLFSAVRKKVMTYHRHEYVVRRTETDALAERPLGMGEGPQATDHDIVENDLRSALRAAFTRLSEIQQQVLTLRWEREMSYDEIAMMLSISLSAAKQHGSRAQRIIRPVIAKFLNRS